MRITWIENPWEPVLWSLVMSRWLMIMVCQWTCPTRQNDHQSLSAPDHVNHASRSSDMHQAGSLLVRLPLPPGTFPTLWKNDAGWGALPFDLWNLSKSVWTPVWFKFWEHLLEKTKVCIHGRVYIPIKRRIHHFGWSKSLSLALSKSKSIYWRNLFRLRFFWCWCLQFLAAFEAFASPTWKPSRDTSPQGMLEWLMSTVTSRFWSAAGAEFVTNGLLLGCFFCSVNSCVAYLRMFFYLQRIMAILRCQ